MEGTGHSGGGGSGRRRDVERWFRQLLQAKNPLGILTSGAWQPPTDVFEAPDAVVVRMEIPGLDTDSLSMCLAEDVLTVRGHRQDRCEHRKVRFQQLEVHFGYFERSIPLAFQVNHKNAKASYNDGFLTIVMPRAQRQPTVSAFYIKINL